jgi:hypothetical protein
MKFFLESVYDLIIRIIQVLLLGIITAIVSGIAVGLFLLTVYLITNIF